MIFALQNSRNDKYIQKSTSLNKDKRKKFDYNIEEM